MGLCTKLVGAMWENGKNSLDGIGNEQSRRTVHLGYVEHARI